MKKLVRVYDSCDPSRELSCVWYEGKEPVCRIFAIFRGYVVDSLCVSAIEPSLCPLVRLSFFVQDFNSALYSFMYKLETLSDLNSAPDDGFLL